jgi:hypothetical protein
MHTYHDYANIRETDPDAVAVDSNLAEVEQSDTGASGASSTNRSEKNFPVKLHYMLSELEWDGLDHIVSWQPHGRCFVVHKQKEFVERIIPL